METEEKSLVDRKFFMENILVSWFFILIFEPSPTSEFLQLNMFQVAFSFWNQFENIKISSFGISIHFVNSLFTSFSSKFLFYNFFYNLQNFFFFTTVVFTFSTFFNQQSLSTTLKIPLPCTSDFFLHIFRSSILFLLLSCDIEESKWKTEWKKTCKEMELKACLWKMVFEGFTRVKSEERENVPVLSIWINEEC